MLAPQMILLAALCGGTNEAPTASGELKPGESRVVRLDGKGTRSVVVALTHPDRLAPGVPVRSMLGFGANHLEKVLHLGDPDVAWVVRSEEGQGLTLELKADGRLAGPVGFEVRVAEVREAADGVAFETEPNNTPETANPLTIGRTVYALADDRPEYPLGDTHTEAEQGAGKDWYRFEFAGDRPRLAFFGIEFVDRDVPPDVRIYRRDETGKVVEHLDGIDPQSLQRERPPRPGANKFTTRVLTKGGTYFVHVDACHPDYQLRTKLYDVPPYLKPGDEADPAKIADAARKAVRVAMDFQLLAGDSWHANTPRKGHATDRVANPHHETSTCIACHPTHFTTQSALAAVESGYRIEEPFAIKFLSERLYNNPVPFHGHPEAVWARMIPAPANVLGRLSTMMMDFENQVAGGRRDNTHRAIGEFLKLYYDGRSELPPDETNGNNPISRYKVAADSWRQLSELVRRTNESKYAETRNLVAKLLATGTHDNTRDLAAQTIGLCTVDPIRHRALIDANVKRLLSLQRPNGHWSPKFDPAYPHAAMQTGESLQALALAGLPADHPAIRKGVVALLKEQGAFGGWIDLSKYEQFQTPFRETQWALISLSTLYPGPGTKGWDSPLGVQPKRLDTSSDSALIRDLERIWDGPSNELLKSVVACVDHRNPLVRLAACETLARVGGSIDVLVPRLGDDSKVVRRSAAEAIRLIGNRVSGSRPPGGSMEQVRFVRSLLGALKADDARTRRGAVRVFAAHFRELSREHALADALLARLDDPDPMVRMGAIKGLWRWWYWDADEGLRNRIEDRLIAVLAKPEHPWVRRNAIEALYIIGDENIRYLYKNWVPSLALKATQDRATAAQHATTARLVAKYVVALDGGPTLQRDGVLRAISEFHERPGGQGRVGNDTEPMLAYDDALPQLTKALIARMGDESPTIRRLALEGLIAVRGFDDPRLAQAVAARRTDEDEGVRAWSATMAKEFPLRIKRGQADAPLLALIDTLLASDRPDAQAAALEMIGQIGPVEAADRDRSKGVRDRLKGSPPVVRATALRTAALLPKLLAEDATRSVVRESLADPDPEVRVAAIRIALDRAGTVPDRILRKALEDATPEHRLALLAAVGSKEAYAKDLRLIGVVSASVVDDNSGVREKSLQVIQSRPTLVNNPAVEEGLRELARSSNARQKEIARALLASRGRSSAADAGGDLLDLPYFEARVLPILNRMGEDGQNCVGCHRSHSILKLSPPDLGERWSPQSARANYRSALRVVNLANPAESLLLGKPTWDAAEEAEAQNDPTKKAHAGGIRFEAKTSAEYQTILDWINGARLTDKKAASR